MGRLREYADAQPVGRVGGCKVGELLDTLEPDDRADLVSMLADRDNYTAALIQRTLEEYGIDIGYNSLTRHRKTYGGCKCPPEVYE